MSSWTKSIPGIPALALVTGASRGIGRAISIKLCKQGYEVLINYNSNDEAAKSTLKEITDNGRKAELLKFNVTEETSTNNAI